MESLITQATKTVVDLVGSELPLEYWTHYGKMVPIKGVFDASHEAQSFGGDMGVVSQGPQLFVELATLPEDPEQDVGAEVVVSGTRYQIHAVERDGKGWALLRLREAECDTPAP